MWDKIVIIFNNWWSDPDTQMWLIQRPFRILITIIAAFIGQWVITLAIRKFATYQKEKPLHSFLPVLSPKEAEIADYEAKARNERKRGRIDTLASVARSTALIVIWAWAALEILRNLGVNVAPIIASAGVVGLAIGFGAQSLVKDFLAGIFMLMEDQYGIGDTIDLGNGVFGDVESISLRITTVRDIDGALWYVRNGEILQVANHSDRYSVARVQVPIALSNDPTRAVDVITSAAEDAARDSEIKDFILAKPTVNGMSGLEVDHMSYRVSVKTLPGKQWDVQRAMQAKILTAMHTEGITTPYPRGMAIFDLEEPGLTRKED